MESHISDEVEIYVALCTLLNKQVHWIINTWRNNLFIQLVFFQSLLWTRYILQDGDPAFQSFVLINNLSRAGGGSSEMPKDSSALVSSLY